MDIKTVLLFAINLFKKHKIKFPHLDAEILLSHILKKPREYILINNNKKLTKTQNINYKSQLIRRIKGEPIAYITGYKEFYGLNFFVNKNVLIPRPETELIVDEILKKIKSQKFLKTFNNLTHNLILDVGTGSGCIITSIVKSLSKDKFNDKILKQSSFLAIDISKSALFVALKNTKLHKINKKIKLIHGDLLKPILNNKKYFKNFNKNIIITANLPYGWNSWKNNCSMDTIGLKFEPTIALFANNKGLKIIENLFKNIKQLSKINNSKSLITTFCEFDPRQIIKLKIIINKILPNAKIKIKKDYSNKNRLAIITI